MEQHGKLTGIAASGTDRCHEGAGGVEELQLAAAVVGDDEAAVG